MSNTSSTSDKAAGSGGGEASYLLQPPEQRRSFYFLQKRRSSSDKEVEMEPLNSTGGGTHVKKSWMDMSSLTNLFGSNGHTGELSKPRKLPVKIEPKVFFANERTFLAWLQMSTQLAAISLAIVAFANANEWSQIYGICLMPVSIAFCCYSLWMYMKRAAMIRRKDPGPYEDRVGPVILASMLAMAIVVNFVVKLYDMSQ